MNDLVHDALHDVGEHTSPPPLDRLAFRARVRAERRRRRGVRAVLAAAAVLAVGGTTLALRPLLDGDAGDASGYTAAPDEAARASTGEQAWFVQQGTLRLLDRTGVLLDSGAPAEQVLGTMGDEGAWYVDDESGVRWMAAVSDGEGGGPALAPAHAPPGVAENPVRGAVDKAVLSGDGRYLAWVAVSGPEADPDLHLLVHDLKADERVQRRAIASGDRLFGVSAAGALVERDGDLHVLGADEVTLPRQDFGSASIADGTVVVRDGAGDAGAARTRVYDVTSGDARLRREVVGLAWPSPYGDRLLVLPADEEAAGPVEVLEGDGRTLLTVSGERPMTFAFAGEDRVLLATSQGQASRLHDCGAGTGECVERFVGPEVRLGDFTS